MEPIGGSILQYDQSANGPIFDLAADGKVYFYCWNLFVSIAL